MPTSTPASSGDCNAPITPRVAHLILLLASALVFALLMLRCHLVSLNHRTNQAMFDYLANPKKYIKGTSKQPHHPILGTHVASSHVA